MVRFLKMAMTEGFHFPACMCVRVRVCVCVCVCVCYKSELKLVYCKLQSFHFFGLGNGSYNRLCSILHASD